MVKKLLSLGQVILFLVMLAGCQSAPTPATGALVANTPLFASVTPVPPTPISPPPITTPAAQSASAETGEVKELAGQWWRTYPAYPEPGKYWWQIGEDGLFQIQQERVVAGRAVTTTLDKGNLWFEGVELQIESSPPGCSTKVGTYQVQRNDGGQLVLTVVNDPCGERSAVLIDEPWQE
jgi:hypothetical protein